MWYFPEILVRSFHVRTCKLIRIQAIDTLAKTESE